MPEARSTVEPSPGALSLEDGSRVAVIGGGPAGAFFTYFLLDTSGRVGTQLSVDIYETKNFLLPGPGGCNMCGGIVSESMVQLLSTEGINLPNTVVQRGIESYILHMDVGSVRIVPPGREKRIAAVHRGAGPRGILQKRWDGLDGHLFKLALAKGARAVNERVDAVEWIEGKPVLTSRSGASEPYDLLAVATGVNAGAMKLLEKFPGYVPPKTTKTFISEFFIGEKDIETYLGSSMHVFLLNVPRLEFAAIVPKGDYVTAVMLGEDLDKELADAFLASSEVRRCFPPGWVPPADFCRCFPSINVLGSPKPYGDRLVFLGDCGESRLYKDGIGGAYRAAKAAVRTVIFEGVSEEDFRRHYRPTCRALANDNRIGKIIFGVTTLIQNMRFSRKGLLRMVSREQKYGGRQRMSGVLWDTFTGSAPYRDVFRRTLHPLFIGRLVYDTAMALLPERRVAEVKETEMKLGELGKVYDAGEPIVRQGEAGECMYVIQSGKVEVVAEDGSREIRLAELGEGDFFGEMALFEKSVRSATVRPVGKVRVLTVDKKMFLRKIHEDPSLAFRVMQKMSQRIRQLDRQLSTAAAEPAEG